MQRALITSYASYKISLDHIDMSADDKIAQYKELRRDKSDSAAIGASINAPGPVRRIPKP